MAGLLTYNAGMKRVSMDVGYAILQAFRQGYLTNSNVTGAATVQDLIDAVNAAVVGPGAESPAQRNSITRALSIGKALGDLSDARVAAATSATNLAEQTWVTDDPAYATGHLGVNLIP